MNEGFSLAEINKIVNEITNGAAPVVNEMMAEMIILLERMRWATSFAVLT